MLAMTELQEVDLHASGFRRRRRPLLAVILGCAALAVAAQPAWASPNFRSLGSTACPPRVEHPVASPEGQGSEGGRAEGPEGPEGLAPARRSVLGILATGAAWSAGLTSASALVRGSPPPKGYGLGNYLPLWELIFFFFLFI